MSRRLAVVSTHPIQYYAPVFRALSSNADLEIHVFYGWEGAIRPNVDPEFGRAVQWDIPLLEGYPHSFMRNQSTDPGPHHHRGIDCPGLTSAILEWEPDVVLMYGWNYKSHLQALRILRGKIPILFRGDSTLLNEKPGPRGLGRRVILRWVYRHVDLALYVGKRNQEYYLRHGLVDEQLDWAPHSVENNRFDDLDGSYSTQAIAWRMGLGIRSDEIVMLYAGKILEEKGLGLLLNTFLRGDFENAHVIFAGSGYFEHALKIRAAANQRVHFLGFQNQTMMPIVYRLADIVILPSFGETWGMVVNEAMASSRPVIVSDKVGCAPDLVTTGETGFIFSLQSEPDLSSILERVTGNPAELILMGRRARALIENWSIEVQVERLLLSLAKV